MERSDFMLKAPPSVPLALVGASQGPFLKITLWYLSCSIDTDERLGCFVPVQFFCDIGHHFSQFVLVFLEKGAKKKQYGGNVYFHFWVFLHCCFVLTPLCSFSGWKHRHRRRDISRWTSERRASPLSCLWSPTCRLGTCESAKVLIKKIMIHLHLARPDWGCRQSQKERKPHWGVLLCRWSRSLGFAGIWCAI